MGSIDTPPFMRAKMKEKIQGTKPDIPPFMQKKSGGGDGSGNAVPGISDSAVSTDKGLDNGAPAGAPKGVSTGVSMFDNPELDPLHQFTPKPVPTVLTAPNGSQFEFNNPTPLGNSPEAINALQARLSANTLSDQDMQVLSTASGKSLPATHAYITQDADHGWAIEAADDAAANKQKMADGIDYYNKLLGPVGLQLDAKDILSDPTKSAQFLQNTKVIQQAEADRVEKEKDYQNQAVAAPGGFVVANKNVITPVDPKIAEQTAELQSSLKNHITDLTAREAYQKGMSPDEHSELLFQRLDPDGYAQSQRLRWNSTSVQSNPIGYLASKVTGSDKKNLEILKTEKTQYEFLANQGLRRIAAEKMADAITSGDPVQKEDALNMLSKVKDDAGIVQSSPLLMLQEMAQAVNRRYAQDAGIAEGSDTQSEKLKLLGPSSDLTSDVIKKYLKADGYYDKAGYKDYADELATHPNTYLADNSIITGSGKSFLTPFTFLFNTLGDITGFRTPADIRRTSVMENMFPSRLTEGIKNEIHFGTIAGKSYDFNLANTVNGISNLAGYTAISAVTGGAALRAGLSESAAERAGAWMAFGMTTPDEAMKEADRMGLTPAQTFLYTGMKSIMMAEGGRLLELPKTDLPVNEVFNQKLAKVAIGLSDKTLAEAGAKEATDGAVNAWTKGLLKYGIGTAKGAGVLTGFGVGDSMLKLAFGDKNTDPAEILPEAANTFFNGLFTMGLFGLPGLKGEVNHAKNSTYKGILAKIVDHPAEAQDVFQIAVDKGLDTKEGFDEKMAILNTGIQAKATLNEAISKSGIKMTSDQRAVWIANRVIEQSLRNRAADVMATPEDIASNLKKADSFKEQNAKIMTGLTFNKFLEPNDALHVAQLEHQQAIADLVANATPENEQAVIDKKAVVDNLSFVTFTYNKESDIPEVFKDKVSSSGETNGKKIFRVTLHKSEADNYLARHPEDVNSVAKVTDAAKKVADAIKLLPKNIPEPKAEVSQLSAYQQPQSEVVAAYTKGHENDSPDQKEKDTADAIEMHLTAVKDALATGKYEADIKDGTLTVADAKAAIESAGVEVPKEITEAKDKVSASPIDGMKDEDAIKMIAQQAHGLTADGKPVKDGKDNYQATVNAFSPKGDDAGKALVDAAMLAHPKEQLLEEGRKAKLAIFKKKVVPPETKPVKPPTLAEQLANLRKGNIVEKPVKPPTINDHPDIIKLKADQQSEIGKVAGPDLSLDLIKESEFPKEKGDIMHKGEKIGDEMVPKKDLVEKQKSISDRLEKLKQIINCLTKK